MEKRKKIKEKKLYLALGKSTKLIRERFNKILEQSPYKISFEQWLILDQIGMQSGISQKGIVNFLHKEPASVSRMVNKLFEKHLLIKNPNPSDKKAYQLFLSDKGHRLFESMKPHFDNEFREIFNNIYERELNLIISILDRLEKSLS